MEYQLGANMKTTRLLLYWLWRLCLECDSCVVFCPPVQSINQSINQCHIIVGIRVSPNIMGQLGARTCIKRMAELRTIATNFVAIQFLNIS